jgi:hypothetical protein
MEVKSKCSFQGCGRTGLLFGWVDATGALDRPLFMSNVALYDSGGEKANVHSPPLINPDVSFKPSLWLS